MSNDVTDIILSRSRRFARAGLWTLIPLALGFTAVASAQDGTKPPTEEQQSDDIVVQGLSKREQSRAVTGYVDALTDMTVSDPLARYEPGIYCPAVFGLSEARNGEIAARMRQAAQTADVRPAPPGCVASAFVFFVDDKASFLKDFAKKQPVFFGDLAGNFEPLKADSGPVTAWLLTRDLDPQHNPIAPKNGMNRRVVSSVAGGSRINSMITRVVAAAVVVVERKAIVGMTATQIADYALMLTLVDHQPKQLGNASRFSILSVMDASTGSKTPMSLTSWDLAYLKSRYEGDARLYGVRKGAEMRSAIRQGIEQQTEPGSPDAKQ